MSEPMTVKQFRQKHHIGFAAPSQEDCNPNMPDWQDADHWRCRFKRDGHSMTVHYSQGYGHETRAPEGNDVLDCIASDACTVENALTFEDFCDELGYDTNSRRAERTHKFCLATRKRLLQFLGQDAYDELLYNVERL